jgi:hypothetical protein
MKEWEKRFDKLAWDILHGTIPKRDDAVLPSTGSGKLILYKYAAISERLKDILAGKHYFATADQLNDPFEVKFDLEMSPDFRPFTRTEFGPISTMPDKGRATLAQRLSVYRWRLRSYIRRFPLKVLEWLILAEYRKRLPQLREHKKSFLLAELARTTGISCYSEFSDNTQMFSHYGQQHRGVCIGFEFFGQGTGGVFGPAPVHYTNAYPILREFPADGNYDHWIQGTVFTKETAWEYEREWRCFTIDGPGLREVAAFCKVSSITFGCRATEESKSMVRELVHSTCGDIPLFQAKRSTRTYSLSIERIS